MQRDSLGEWIVAQKGCDDEAGRIFFGNVHVIEPAKSMEIRTSLALLTKQAQTLSPPDFSSVERKLHSSHTWVLVYRVGFHVSAVVLQNLALENKILLVSKDETKMEIPKGQELGHFQ